MTLHVCLLYPGGPTPEKSIRTFLEEQLHDPLVQDSLPGFFRSFWIWMLLFLRNRTPLLEGPCSSYLQADEHVQELNRLLGPDFRCYALHHFGKANIESVFKSIPNRSKVVLLPLIPHRCRTLFSTLAQARTELHSKKCTIIEWGNYGTDESFVQSVCIQIRKQIITYAKLDYGIVFLEQRQPEKWNQSTSEYRDDAQSTVSAVMNVLGTTQPHTLIHTSAKSLSDTLQDWKSQSISTIITIPTSWVLTSELLRAEEKKIKERSIEIGFEQCLHAGPLRSQVFDAFLIEKLRGLLERAEA
jgi:protoheme ferro-lyase